MVCGFSWFYIIFNEFQSQIFFFFFFFFFFFSVLADFFAFWDAWYAVLAGFTLFSTNFRHDMDFAI